MSLRRHGDGMDTNGVKVVIIGYPNRGTFSSARPYLLPKLRMARGSTLLELAVMRSLPTAVSPYVCYPLLILNQALTLRHRTTQKLRRARIMLAAPDTELEGFEKETAYFPEEFQFHRGRCKLSSSTFLMKGRRYTRPLSLL